MADCDSFLGSHDTLLFPALDGHDAENILTADFASEIFRDVDNLHRVHVHAQLDPEDAALDESNQYLVNGDDDDDVNWLDSPTGVASPPPTHDQGCDLDSQDKFLPPPSPPAAPPPTSTSPYLNGASPMYYSPLPLPYSGPSPADGSLPLFGHLPHPVGGHSITPQMAAQMSAQVQQQMMPYSYALPGPLPLPMQGQIPGINSFEPFRPRGGRSQHRGSLYGVATASRRLTPIAPNPHPLRPSTPEEQSSSSSPRGPHHFAPLPGEVVGADGGGDSLADLLPSSRLPPRHTQMHRSMSSHALGQLSPLLPLPCFPPPPVPGILPPLPPGMRRVHSTGDLQTMALPGLGLSPFDDRFRVGRYSVDERKVRIERYRLKRHERNYSKKIKYACRKTLADSRPRVRGRFARNDDMGDEMMDYDIAEEEGELEDKYADMLERVLGGDLGLLQANGGLYKVKREPV